MNLILRSCLLGRRVGDFRSHPGDPDAPLRLLEEARSCWLPETVRRVWVLRACFSNRVARLEEPAVVGQGGWAVSSPAGVDGGIVEGPGQAVAVCNGDCPLLCLIQGQRLAVLHAGYRCLVREAPDEPNIIETALAAGFDSSATTAWVGWGVGPCCWAPDYASKPELLAPETSHEASLLARCLTRTTRSPLGAGHVAIDLYQLADDLLRRAGVGPGRVGWDTRCTCCAREDGEPAYWSRTRWKRSGGPDGRNCCLAWLEDPSN